MSLWEAPKRRHDPNSLVDNHFVKEHMEVSYVHREHMDDSFYRGEINFSSVVSRIPTPEEKTFVFQYQKDLKTKVLHFRQLQLTVEENVEKQVVEKEVKESLDSSSSDPTEKSKDKGNIIFMNP